MKQNRKKLKMKLKIVGATLTAIFSLFSVFTATYAWFSSNTSTTVSGASVTVKALEGIQYDFYYLDYFGVKNNPNYKDGNFDTVNNNYAGYEVASSNPVFTKINYDENGDVINDLVHDSNPTSINHLWPAHKLTYAIVISGGTLSSFNLDSWGEITDPTIKINAETNVSLSWAINLYGGAYYIPSTASVLDDIATGFVSYNTHLANGTLVDKFTYSQNSPAPNEKTPIIITNSIFGSSGENKRVILFFSIEFSNADSTFYSYSNPYYVKDPLGDSNCYEKLSLTGLSFKLA